MAEVEDPTTTGLSGWYLDGIELPIAPSSIERRVIRKPDLSKTEFGFPVLFNPGPQSYDLVIKGWVWPTIKVYQLDLLARAAETEIVQLYIPAADEQSVYRGKYAIDRSAIKMEGPTFTEFGGGDVAAWQYEITLVQFADEGENQDSIEGGLDLDEIGIGFGDITLTMPEIDISNFDPFEDLGIDFTGL